MRGRRSVRLQMIQPTTARRDIPDAPAGLETDQRTKGTNHVRRVTSHAECHDQHEAHSSDHLVAPACPADIEKLLAALL